MLATLHNLNDPEGRVQLVHEADCRHLAASPLQTGQHQRPPAWTGRVLLSGGELPSPDLCRAMLELSSR